MSCVLLDTNSIFVRNLKIAGSSLNSLILKEKKFKTIWLSLSQYKNPHINLSQIIDILGEERIYNFWTFTIVRNPWDWFVSLFFYIKTKIDHPLYYLTTNFDYFVVEYCKKHVLKQEYFVYYNNYAVDHVFKFEELHIYWPLLKEKLKFKEDIKKTNTTSHKNYQYYYNNTTKNLVFKYENRIIKDFKYEF